MRTTNDVGASVAFSVALEGFAQALEMGQGLLCPPTLVGGWQAHVLAAAHAIGVEVQIFSASTEGEIDSAFGGLLRPKLGCYSSPMISTSVAGSTQLVALAARYAVPTTREFALAWGLMSYGISLADDYRLTGLHAARVLKGEKKSPAAYLLSKVVRHSPLQLHHTFLAWLEN